MENTGNIQAAERDYRAVFQKMIHRVGAQELLDWLGTTDFFVAPASTRYHGAYPGGLVRHSLNVYYALIGDYTLRETETETTAICALLHDVCKANYYAATPKGYAVQNALPMGHGEKSVFLISRYMRLTDEEALAIRWHMGAYDDAARGGSRELSAAMAFSPLVYALHAADMRATLAEPLAKQDQAGLG